MKVRTLLTSALAAGLLVIFGATAFASFYPTGGTTYRLQSSIGTANTTVNLSSFKEPGSNTPYTMSYLNSSIECGTLDPSSNNSEFISFTGITQNGDGTAQLTGVLRGLGRSYPYAASSTLAFSHAGQSVFILSDAPCLFIQYAVKQNNESITGNWHVPDPTDATSTANKEYVDGKVFAGIGGASETATGTVQIATGAQAAASTMNGTLGRLVVPSSLATSTYNAATAANKVVVTGLAGTIDPNFIVIGSTTPIGSVRGTDLGLQQRIFSTTGTTTWSVPTGVRLVRAIVQGGGANGGSCSGTWSGASGGSAGGYAEGIYDVSATTSVQLFVGAVGAWSTFGTNGFFESGNPGNNGATGGTSYTLGGTASSSSLALSAATTTGQNGGASQSGNNTGAISITGPGGSSLLGLGGVSQPNGTGTNGTGYGSGGSGGWCASSAGSFGGGLGQQGLVILQW